MYDHPHEIHVKSKVLIIAVAVKNRGAVPPEMGNLTRLEGLYLHNNLLAGPLPYELSTLVNLRELYISGNAISSSLKDVEFLLPNCKSVYI